jgi:hypothetical protein
VISHFPFACSHKTEQFFSINFKEKTDRQNEEVDKNVSTFFPTG